MNDLRAIMVPSMGGSGRALRAVTRTLAVRHDHNPERHKRARKALNWRADSSIIAPDVPPA
jgi:hypothetical protein